MAVSRSQTIGAKLIAAFTCSTLLLTIVCLIAWGIWNNLDAQVNRLLEESVPKYNASYFLESRSSEIRQNVERLESADNKVVLAERAKQINLQLGQILNSLMMANGKPMSAENRFVRLQMSYQGLNALLQDYVDLAAVRIDHRRKVSLLVEQVDWLHQDIYSELTPLRQDLYWQIERADDPKTLDELVGKLNALQQVLDIQRVIYELTMDLVKAKTKEQVNNGMKVIHYRLLDLAAQSAPLWALSTSIAYEQLLEETLVLLKNEGSFQQQLLLEVDANMQMSATRTQIVQWLGAIHNDIAQLVEEADQTFANVKQETTQKVSYGNHVLIICFTLSILISLFLAYYFINRRIVARLINLSTSIDATINNKLNHPIVVDGNDEIGQLSAKLIEYGERVREIQETNALSLINNTSACLMTCNLHGEVESANLSARELLGLETIEPALSVYKCFPESCREPLQRIFEGSRHELLLSKPSVILSVGTESNPRFLRCDLRIFEHGTSEKLIMTITDVTLEHLTTRDLEDSVLEKSKDLKNKNIQLELEIEERKRTELHLKNTQDELIQAAKMAVLGQTMTSLAHELNQPLNAMSTYVFSAKMHAEKSQDSAVLGAIDHIESLTQRMSRIINSLRQFARKQVETGSPERVNIHDAAEQAIMLVNTHAKRQQIAISNQLPNNIDVRSNAISLEQVLVNLLVNSCDAILEKGTTACRDITVSLFSMDSNKVVIAVSDQGPGFDESLIDNIFQPFVTTKEVGLGLGMNICKSLVEKYQGDLYLASNLEAGALVLVELPHEQ